jgi:hypothetical protein
LVTPTKSEDAFSSLVAKAAGSRDRPAVHALAVASGSR